MDCSIGGALELGSGLRYREIMVIPLENCSVGKRLVMKIRIREKPERTNVFAGREKRVKMIQIGQSAVCLQVSCLKDNEERERQT